MKPLTSIRKTLSQVLRNATSVLLSLSFVLPASLLPATTIAHARDHSVSLKKESSDDFDAFLEKCSQKERIFLMQSMQALPKIPPNAFGNLGISVEVDGKSHEITLKPYEDYSDEIRPKTFNELPPVLVLQAVEKGLLSVSWSPKDIKKELYWNAHHWSKFLFGNKDKINYHEIVEWCAQKEKIVGDPVVSKKEIDALSTYDLSQVVSEKYLAKQFNDLWNKLDLAQKGETIGELESKTGKKFTEFQRKTLINWDSATREDKARVCKELNESNRNTGTGQVVLSASMGAGAVVLGGLGVAVSVMGFAFYTTVTSMIAFVAASLGTTLAFSVYTTTTTTLAVLSGPWGWCIAGGLLVLSPFAVGWADTEKCANFIVAKHTIESSWLLPTTQADCLPCFWRDASTKKCTEGR